MKALAKPGVALLALREGVTEDGSAWAPGPGCFGVSGMFVYSGRFRVLSNLCVETSALLKI